VHSLDGTDYFYAGAIIITVLILTVLHRELEYRSLST
jgi:hypothetical protein